MSSIKKRANGQWRARYRDTEGREHARHFATRSQAQRWLDETTAAVVTGQYVDPRAGKITFSCYYARWAQRQVWAINTKKAMDLAANSVPFANAPIAAVTRSDIEQWVKAMLTVSRGKGRPAGLAVGTIKTRVNNVRSVFRAAVRDRVIASDPSDGVALPRPRRAEAAMTLPSMQQVGALISAADDSFKPFIGLAAFAGLRLGEVAALQVGDIDFLRYTIRVSRQVQRLTGGGVAISPPKYGSERTVFAPKSLIEMISAHLAANRRTEPTNWVFQGEDGPPHQNTAGYWWRKTCETAEVTGVKMHDLRHFFASGLIADGCDVVTVQRALGHARATTTLNTYSHLWPTAEDRTRKAAQALFEKAVSGPEPLVLADNLRTTKSGSRRTRRSEG